MRRRQDHGTPRGRAATGRPALVLLLLALLPELLMAGSRKPLQDRPHQDRSHHDTRQAAPQREASGRCPGMSLDQAISGAERKYKARVVKANVESNGEGCVYVLRLLSEDGRVWTVRVDSRSGG